MAAALAEEEVETMAELQALVANEVLDAQPSEAALVEEEVETLTELERLALEEEAAWIEVMKHITALEEGTADVPAEEAAGEELISTALFDITPEELVAIEALEDEILEEEALLLETAVAADEMGDLEAVEAAVEQIAALEEERDELLAKEMGIVVAEEEDEVTAAQDLLADVLTNAEITCDNTWDAYVAAVADLKLQLKETNGLTVEMANSLAEIDPNTENGPEGTALIRRMYKVRGETPVDLAPAFP